MLTVTESAKHTLAKMLDDANAPDDKAARFVTQGDQITLALDQQKEGDKAVDHDGRTLLLLSPDVDAALDGKELDLIETPQGSGLGLKPATPPEATPPEA